MAVDICAHLFAPAYLFCAPLCLPFVLRLSLQTFICMHWLSLLPIYPLEFCLHLFDFACFRSPFSCLPSYMRSRARYHQDRQAFIVVFCVQPHVPRETPVQKRDVTAAQQKSQRADKNRQPKLHRGAIIVCAEGDRAAKGVAKEQASRPRKGYRERIAAAPRCKGGESSPREKVRFELLFLHFFLFFAKIGCKKQQQML